MLRLSFNLPNSQYYFDSPGLTIQEPKSQSIQDQFRASVNFSTSLEHFLFNFFSFQKREETLN